MDQRDRAGDRLQGHAPVNRGITSADNDDIAVAERLDSLGEVVNAFAFAASDTPGAAWRFGSNAPTPAQMITVLL